MGQSIDHANGSNEAVGDVIFSFVDGYVWASWPGSDSMMRIGEYPTAVAAMRDFLAQCDLAERLSADRSPS